MLDIYIIKKITFLVLKKCYLNMISFCQGSFIMQIHIIIELKFEIICYEFSVNNLVKKLLQIEKNRNNIYIPF